MSKLVDKERLDQLAKALDQRAKAAVEAEKTRAEAAEKRIEGKADANTNAIAAINNVDTGILANAKSYTDESIERVNGENAAVAGRVTVLEGTVGDASKGLVKDVNDLKTSQGVQDGKISENTAAIEKLNGADTVDGSVAKTVKDAVAPVSAKVNALETTVGAAKASETPATGLFKAIEDGDATTLAAAKLHAETKIAELVNGAPDAMNTLKELADAIEQHQGVYEAYIAQVDEKLAKKVDKVEGARLITEVEAAQYAAKAEVSAVTQALADAKAHTNTEVGKVTPKVTALEEKVGDDSKGLVKEVADLKTKDAAQDEAIAAAKAQADKGVQDAATVAGKVTTLEGVVGNASKGLVKDVAANAAAIAAINSEDTGILVQAKTFATSEAGRVDGKVTALNGDVSALKATVGTSESGLVKEVADVKAKNTAQDGEIANNKAAIATLNGDATTAGSVDKKIVDALASYSDTAAVKSLLSNVVNSLSLTIADNKIKLNLGGVDGVTLTETTLNLATSEDIDAIIAGLDTTAL